MVPKSCLWFSKKNMSEKKSGFKILWANQIAVFVDHQYLWKESSGILVIFHRVGIQGKAAFETAVVWSDIPRFDFYAIRLHNSLIINILGKNKVMF